MEDEKRSGWRGPRVAGPGKKMGRPLNKEKGLPERKRKQFSLYPADIEALERLAPEEGSVLIRGLIRYAEGLPAEKIWRLLGLGTPPR